MRKYALAIGGLVAATGSVWAASPTAPKTALPPLYSAVLDCLAVPDRDARLACFEDAARKLKAATERQDIVVVDKEQIKKTKHTLFGLPLPRIDILGGDNGQDEVKQVDGIVGSAHRDGDGRDRGPAPGARIARVPFDARLGPADREQDPADAGRSGARHEPDDPALTGSLTAPGSAPAGR